MRAIILAAGEGTRLHPHTLDRPKCMVELAGKPLIVRQIDVLKQVGIDNITLVTGYRAETLERLGYETRHNPNFDRTNMVSTLMCASEVLEGGEDVIIAYADIVYEPRVLEALIASPDPLSTTVDRQWQRLWKLRHENPITDAETLKLDDRGYILELGKKPNSLSDIQGQYMGLTQAGADFAAKLGKIHGAMDANATYDGKNLDNIYMTSFLQYLIDTGHPLRAAMVDGGWLEIDTTEDLDIYNRMQEEGTLQEFCYLE